jgi:hypothetical protein
MISRPKLSQLVLTALLASLVALAADHLLRLPVARAQAAGGALDGMSVHASPRRDTDKDGSFIFVSSKTGDIWVYRDKDFKDHYKVVELGQPLQVVEHR